VTTPIPQRTHELLEALDRAVVTLPRMLQSTAVAAVIAFRPLLYTGVFWLVALKRKLLDELEEVPRLHHSKCWRRPRCVRGRRLSRWVS